MTSFLDNTFVQGLFLLGDNAGEVRLATPATVAASYTLTLPESLPSVAGDNVLSVANSGVISNMNLGNHAVNSGKILKTVDGSSIAWTSLSTNPQIVGLSGTNASFSGNCNYVLTLPAAAATYRIQISTSFNPAALPAIAAVNAGYTSVGTQPSAVAVATTSTVNDSIVFTWTPDPAVTRLTLANFTDSRGGAGTSLFVGVTPVLPTTISHVTMEHDAAEDVPHTTFTASAENNLCFRFTRALDPTHPLPVVTSSVGSASSLRYEGRGLHAVWTPAGTVAGTGSLVVASVRDVLGFTVLNPTVSSLTTVAAMTLSSLLVRDTSTSTKRTYAVLSQTHDAVAAFSRNVKRVTHSASMPTRSAFNTLTAYEVTPAAASYTHSFTTGDVAGFINHRILAIDATHNLPYVFTPITLVQAKLAANGFTQVVNKRGAAYTTAAGKSVSMDFTRPVVAITSASASAGTLSVIDLSGAGSGGDVRCDYTTPATVSTDTLTFLGVKDDVLNDVEPSISFAVTDLLRDPQFASWVVEPNARDFLFDAASTRARARFSTPLSSVAGITVSSGTTPTNVSIVPGPDGKNTDVEFDWNTAAAVSPVTLSFNGLVSADGQPDVSPTENVALTLLSPPTFSAWNVQAFEPSKKKTLRATFSKTLANPGGMMGVVTPSVGSVDANSVLVDAGQLVFDYTPPLSLAGLAFTFTKLQATDGSRLASLVVPAGPAVTSFNATGAFQTGPSVLVGRVVNYTFVFTKSLLSAPTFTVDGGGLAASAVHATNTVSVDITATSSTRLITLNGVYGLDGSVSTGVPVSVLPVASLNINRLEFSANPGVAVFENAGLFNKTTASLIARFSGGLNTAAPLPSAAASAGVHPNVVGYNGPDGVEFTWTPSVAGANSLTFLVRDANNFSTPVQSSAYTVLATEPPRWVSTSTAKRTVSAPTVFDGDSTGHAGYAVPVRVRFNKTLSAAPTPVLNGGGTVGVATLATTVVANDTVVFSATSALATSQITFENIFALDGSSVSGTVLSFPTNPTIGPAVRTELQLNPGIPLGATPVLSTRPGGTGLRLVFPKPSAVSGGVGFVTVSVSANNGAVTDLAIESGFNLIFSYRPASVGSSIITVYLRRDNFGFEYPLVSTDPIIIS